MRANHYRFHIQKFVAVVFAGAFLNSEVRDEFAAVLQGVSPGQLRGAAVSRYTDALLQRLRPVYSGNCSVARPEQLQEAEVNITKMYVNDIHGSLTSGVGQKLTHGKGLANWF